MIPTIVIGQKGITFKGKNTALLAGKPLASYPISAALQSQLVDDVFVSTDDDQIVDIALELGAQTISRPPELATNSALGEDVFVHAYNTIKSQRSTIEMVVLLFCNSPTISSEIIDQCIIQLRNSPDADSIVRHLVTICGHLFGLEKLGLMDISSLLYPLRFLVILIL